jgi:hypothetical protein
MQGWLSALPSEGALLFCHPGASSGSAADDPIGAARKREFEYLRGEEFVADLAAAGVVLGPVWQTPLSGTTTPG